MAHYRPRDSIRHPHPLPTAATIAGGQVMRTHHQWRQKSKHQQICTICGQVKRWDGFRWLYRKQGQLVRQRPTCGEKRTDSERYAELRQLVEQWQQWQRNPQYDTADASERLMDWKHR